MSDFSLNGRTGVAAMVRIGAWCETELDMDVVQIGRAGLDRRESCTLSMTGVSFLYELKIDGGWLTVSVMSMDTADEPERLFTVGDTELGWWTAQRFIMALEKSGLRSLQQRPCEIDLNGPHGGFVLG